MIVLGLAQFVMVIDGTVMNVSITAVVTDLNTTVSSMQLAIATFTLTMAALMLAGAGLGDRIGRRRTFIIGVIVYAVGSLITALATGFEMLFIGWSIIEGIGAAMVIPAIAALAAVATANLTLLAGHGMVTRHGSETAQHLSECLSSSTVLWICVR